MYKAYVHEVLKHVHGTRNVFKNKRESMELSSMAINHSFDFVISLGFQEHTYTTVKFKGRANNK